MKDLIPIMGVYGTHDRDVTIIKKIGERIKVCNLAVVRKKGIEVSYSNIKKTEGMEKTKQAISRARTKIQEYIECNDFVYFVTLTINKEKYDRYDLQAYYKDFAKWINNKNRSYPQNPIQYIFVPEMHEDGAWHLHGVMKGGFENDLQKNNFGYLDWEDYKQRFGFISLDLIRSKNATARYVSKYITKDVDRSVNQYGGHLYYCSHGLIKPSEIFRGTARLVNGAKWDFITDDGFCRIKNFKITDNIGLLLEVIEEEKKNLDLLYPDRVF